MKLSFKKRIALFNTLAVAITTAIVFIVIYAVARFSSFRHLDNDILKEKTEILNSLDRKNNSIIIKKMPELEETEHRKVEVNPNFIQIVDNEDKLVFKSANLQANHFLYNPNNKTENFYNTRIGDQRLRIGQFPVKNDEGKIIGYLTVGVSQQESYYVLSNLLFTLCIIFPVVLLVMYIVIYMSASKAIAPVNQLIRAASGITDSNINTRLPLPVNHDELYQLATTINELLQRIENSIQQQKQFTADASHEIRTPLSAIRGTLEILLRKKKEPEQYEEKIKEAIGQTDRLNYLLEQLLQLARMESGSIKKEIISLHLLVSETAKKWEKQMAEREVCLKISFPGNSAVYADHFLMVIIMDNLFSNAIKYGAINGKISCDWDEGAKIFSITNEGPGISREQIPLLFNRFYRTDDTRSTRIPGNGLGLAIVKQLCDLQQINISVQSHSSNTTFHLQFPAKS
ncbi:MAG: HAMP domain-containing protein [Bacteroidota bacterium]|nr:HAMP domain-containing protein [Bacteroidota bacterium]